MKSYQITEKPADVINYTNNEQNIECIIKHKTYMTYTVKCIRF